MRRGLNLESNNLIKKNLDASTSRLVIFYPPQLWLGNFSRKFPYLEIKITAFVPISVEPFIGNSMIQISGVISQEIFDFLEKQDSLISYSVLEKSEQGLFLSTHTKDPFFLKAIVKSGILVKLPVKVFEGTAEFVINGSRENIDEFITILGNKNIQVEIKQLGTFDPNLISFTLTPKQYEIYQQAKNMGYYNSPREITLTDLAVKLNMAKSSLSGMLQRIHTRLLGNP